VSNGLETEKAAPPRAAPLMSCGRCDGIPISIAIFDNRNGQSFRIFKCARCDDISWHQDR
jgi:hypothetical protein